MPEPGVRERLGWEAEPEESREIRRLWIAHSKAEDGRDLAGLIATLTPNCVHEIASTSQRWEVTREPGRSTRRSSARFPMCTSICAIS